MGNGPDLNCQAAPRQKNAVPLRFRGFRKSRENCASTASFFLSETEDSRGRPICQGEIYPFKILFLKGYPDREKTIRENMDYLLDNFEAIAITKQNEASLNDGCTEPHVSHVLSTRLCSRPMGWSKETLRQLVPILAAGAATFDQVDTKHKPYPSASVFLRTTTKRFLPNTAGLADPDHAVTFPLVLIRSLHCLMHLDHFES